MLASLSRPQISVRSAEQTFSVCTAPLNLKMFSRSCIHCHTVCNVMFVFEDTVARGLPNANQNNWIYDLTDRRCCMCKIMKPFEANLWFPAIWMKLTWLDLNAWSWLIYFCALHWSAFNYVVGLSFSHSLHVTNNYQTIGMGNVIKVKVQCRQSTFTAVGNKVNSNRWIQRGLSELAKADRVDHRTCPS